MLIRAEHAAFGPLSAAVAREQPAVVPLRPFLAHRPHPRGAARACRAGSAARIAVCDTQRAIVHALRPRCVHICSRLTRVRVRTSATESATSHIVPVPVPVPVPMLMPTPVPLASVPARRSRMPRAERPLLRSPQHVYMHNKHESNSTPP